MKKSLIKILVLLILITSFTTIFSTKPSSAYSEQSNIGGQLFYIKNAYSGRYLDVSGGVAENGNNVQQYEFNGTDSQKWYAFYQGDGLYQFGALVGSTVSNGTRYYNYALDINGGTDGNGVNIQIWSPNTSNAQRFALDLTENRTYRIRGAVNFNRTVTVENAGCSNGSNVFMWQYNGTHNDEWLLEPVTRSTTNEWFGVHYGIANATRTVAAYPNCRGLGGDCANFASQCMLAAGIHFENEWYTYRKNGNYSTPVTVDQLNDSWSLAAPSPWISAKEFEKYWTSRKNTLVIKGSDILSTPRWYENSGFYMADVVQELSDGFLGIGRQAVHTMYITGVGTAANGDTGFKVSYHSSDRQNVSLLDIINPDKYYKFYAL